MPFRFGITTNQETDKPRTIQELSDANCSHCGRLIGVSEKETQNPIICWDCSRGIRPEDFCFKIAPNRGDNGIT